MELTTHQIITCLQLADKNNVIAIGNYAQQHNITVLNLPADMANFLNMCIDKHIIVMAQKFTLAEVEYAIKDATCLLEKSEENGIRAVSYFDDLFPPQLKTILQNGNNVCPIVLYYKGDIAALQNSVGVAIIGTRKPTKEGFEMGQHFGKAFAEEGFNVVSGLALGCDTAAHNGALRGRGFTTAIVAHGLDTVYPNNNEYLASNIVENGGLLLSEYPVGTPCTMLNLVSRCRLQAGLADAVVVIQTNIKKGGSMHAVRTSAANKKPVFAVQYPTALNNELMVQGNLKLLNERTALPLHKDNLQNVINIIKQNIKN
jgi:DNA processing protein